jgi:glycosyltransferase involved in cell wall biosynthesis
MTSHSTFPGGFTVLMAVYKNDDIVLFGRAVDSVYSNTLRPDAFILVVDGPVPDAMQRQIQRLHERYLFDLIWLPFNLGLAGALNVGLTNVRTEWVARADADDINAEHRFALQADAIWRSCNKLDIIGGAIQEVDLAGRKTSIRSPAEEHQEILRYAAYRCPFNHMTVVYRASLAVQCGGYPTDIFLKEDYALWGKMLASGARSINLPDVLVFATAGIDMYVRRGGKRYALSEIALQKRLVNLGLKSRMMGFIHGLGRASIFFMPAYVRGWIYRRVLRS